MNHLKNGAGTRIRRIGIGVVVVLSSISFGAGIEAASASSPPRASQNPAADIKQLNGFNVEDLFNSVNEATQAVNDKLKKLQQKGENISIADMLEIQTLMNKLSQLSEITTGVVRASNSAISSMARNVKS